MEFERISKPYLFDLKSGKAPISIWLNG